MRPAARLLLALPPLLVLAGAARGGTPEGPAADHGAAAALRAGPVGEEAGPFRERLHRVPVPEEGGGPAPLVEMRLCRPPGAAEAAPLAVLNHGSPPNAAARPGMRPAACEAEPVRWFLARGYAVALPLRRGYGASGGAWAEGFGRCGSPDFGSAGRETARDIAAALAYARALPEVRADTGALVVGHSAGGWGAVALAGQHPQGVAAVVSLAGGRGGWAGGTPGANCRPDLLVAEAGRLGAAAAARRAPPMLWVYAANDSFFGPRLAAALHAAFTAKGGAASLVDLPAFGRDGHGLFFARDGSAVWGPVLEGWLAARGLPAEEVPAAAAASGGGR
jgi:pimeloyl-ACP methyl ester carboxylesterase